MRGPFYRACGVWRKLGDSPKSNVPHSRYANIRLEACGKLGFFEKEELVGELVSRVVVLGHKLSKRIGGD